MSTWSLTVNSFPIFFLGLCIKASHVWWGYLHDDELFIIDVFMFVFLHCHGPLRVWQTCLLSVTASIVYNSHSQLTFITNFGYLKEIIFFFPHSWTIFVYLKAILYIAYFISLSNLKASYKQFFFSVLLNQEVRSQRCILNVASLNLKAP